MGLALRLDIEKGLNFSAPEFDVRTKKYWQIIALYFAGFPLLLQKNL